MREANVVGAGRSEFCPFPDETRRSLFGTACEAGTAEATAPAQAVSTATVEASGRTEPIVRRISPRRGTRYSSVRNR